VRFYKNVSASHATEVSTRLRKPAEIEFYFKSCTDLCAGEAGNHFFIESGLFTCYDRIQK